MTPSYCPHCGASVFPGAQYCTVCGQNISAEQALVTTAKLPARNSLSETFEAELLASLREATLGEYEVVGELGRGGMAVVYLAHDIALDRKVAIKVMAPGLISVDGMVERFKREARTSARLTHPHIIPIFTVKETDRLLYFVMKFVPGRALDSIIKEKGALPIKMIVTILAQVGGALGYAHRQGIIHRDIKPANIMIDEEGWAVVTDFGIAKPSNAENLTTSGMLVGTPAYMSPEQCSEKPVSGASDQYSLGVVAYEMVTGRQPFKGESLMELMKKHFFNAHPPITQARPDCPDELVRLIDRMLSKEAKARWPRMEEVVKALGATPLDDNDPIRLQMVELATSGKEYMQLAQFSTPRSPIPTVDVDVSDEKEHQRDSAADSAVDESFEVPTAEAPPVESAVQPPEVPQAPEPEEAVQAQSESGVPVSNAGEPDRRPAAIVGAVVAAVVLVAAIIGVAFPGAPLVGSLGIMVRGGGATSPGEQVESPVAVMGEDPGTVADSSGEQGGDDNERALNEPGEGARTEEQPPREQQGVAPTTPAPITALPTTGTLVFENAPPGASIYVDDRPVQGNRVELAAGEHVVQMSADGYETEQRRVTIAVGVSNPLSFSLRRLAQTDPDVTTPPPSPESVSAVADSADLVVSILAPRNAPLVLDGVGYGVERVHEIQVLANAEHTIHVASDGYIPFDTVIVLSPGETLELPVRLTRRNP